MLDFFKICGRITQVSGCSAGGSALEWGSRGRQFGMSAWFGTKRP